MNFWQRLLRKDKLEKQLDAELRFHFDEQVAANLRAGMSEAEARRQARLQVGGLEQLKEDCRDARGTRWLENFWMDLRFALRTLRRAPVFTITIVAVLACCIGANTAIFSVVDMALFHPLPFPDQERLVSVTEGVPATGFSIIPFSCPDYLFVVAHNRSFASTGTYRKESYEISGAGEPRRAYAARITASLFQVLQAQPIIGRTFTQEEYDGAKALAVLNYGFARSLFTEPERALGRTIHLNRKPYTVIGVMPPSFSFPLRGLRFSSGPADLFVPVSWSKDAREQMFNNFDYNMIARLRPNVTIPQGAADVQRLLKTMSATYPPEVVKFIERIPNFSLESHVKPFHEEVTRKIQRPLLLLLAAVGVVLLIGCADVANLIFSRMVGRQREFALRSALGAGNWRLVRQTITEGLVLSIAGGVAGFCLAFWALPLLLRLAPDTLPQVNEAGLNWRATAFVVAVTLATPLFFCLAPLLDVIRFATGQLRSGGRTSTQGKHQRFMMSGTVIVQFSLAFVLLTAAGLLVRSFIKASEADPGFRSEHVMSVRLSLPDAVYDKQYQVTNFFNRLLAGVSTLPGVQQTGAMSELPMGSTSNRVLSAEGRAGIEKIDTIFCTGNALESLRVPLVRGRFLQPGDEIRKQRVAVISETLAKRVWPNKDPIRRQIKFGGGEKEPWITIVGVVKDIKSELTSFSPRSLLFTTPEDWVREMNVLVRTSGDPRSLANAIRHQVKQLDPRLPIEKIETLDQVLDQSLSAERFRTLLLASFAAAALLLAMLGIAGLLAYNTAQRAQEFGVRIALGADRRDLLLLVLKQSLQLSGIGIVIGLIASIFVTRLLSAFLYETSRYDVGTFVAVPLILALVALGASALPAWRAAHTDPIAALKTE